MIEKINIKINEEIEKQLKKENLTLEDLKYLIEIKNSLKMEKKFDEIDLSNGGFVPIDIKE